uniref:CSC1-like protein RXW8 n=1 Tax=Kalanchoe fedtschenkoi TaxID=63787 RepID=A0A7N1A999_KALFE
MNYKSITNLRLAYISRVPANPSHFTVFVRSIPSFMQDSYTDSVKKYFMKYYASSYLSHQMVHRCGKVHKLLTDAEKMYKMLKSTTDENQGKPSFVRCGLCGEMTSSFRILSDENNVKTNNEVHNFELTRNQKEYPAAFVFFKTRYGAFTASQVLQSSNPMLWVTDLAPDPCDVYWSNLCIPYRQLWIRRIATLIAAIAFMLLFLIPVTVVQALTDAGRLARTFPFLKKILKWKFMTQVVEGYLPSVILMLFLYTAPPLMMLFSAVEGSISRIGRKRSACCKVLYFTIWNVFFVNIFSGTILKQLDSLSYLKNIPIRLGQAVPSQAILFMTYIMTSGWASLSVELLQPFMLLANLFSRYILKKETPPDGTLSFPYHTEVPRVLLFGLIGLTCSVLAPLITPFLLVYFTLAYLVYRNQFLNVYIEKYKSGGQFWPIAHNSTIFSLVLAQIIAIGVFGLKKSPVASGFTIPLVICTLLFNEYCRQRFYPVFKKYPAEVLMDMDFQDEQNGRMEEIHGQLPVAYCQFTVTSPDFCRSGHSVLHDTGKNAVDSEIKDLENRPSLVDSEPLEENQQHMNVSKC